MKRSRELEEDRYSPSAASDDLDPPLPGEAGLPRSKIAEIDAPEDPAHATSTMICLLHKDKLAFQSYDEYESHYNKTHLNRCLECRRNFPSSYLLAVHIEDCHDSLAEVKRDKGEHTVSDDGLGGPTIHRRAR